MNTLNLALSVTVVGLLLSACSSEETPAAPTSRPSGSSSAAPAAFDAMTLKAVWPETGSTVFSTFDLVVGTEDLKVPGSIAVVIGDGIPKGQAVTNDGTTQLFPQGMNHGSVSLLAGSQSVTVQALDPTGRSMGPDMAHTVRYEVVEKPADTRVFFAEPVDGATVGTRFKVVFGTAGVGMSPAMENAADKRLGHHHILINKGPIPAGSVVPKDASHLHYGKAQTETEVELEPGEYTLTMQFADGNHRSYGPALTSAIVVTVK